MKFQLFSFLYLVLLTLFVKVAKSFIKFPKRNAKPKLRLKLHVGLLFVSMAIFGSMLLLDVPEKLDRLAPIIREQRVEMRQLCASANANNDFETASLHIHNNSLILELAAKRKRRSQNVVIGAVKRVTAVITHAFGVFWSFVPIFALFCLVFGIAENMLFTHRNDDLEELEGFLKIQYSILERKQKLKEHAKNGTPIEDADKVEISDMVEQKQEDGTIVKKKIPSAKRLLARKSKINIHRTMYGFVQTLGDPQDPELWSIFLALLDGGLAMTWTSSLMSPLILDQLQVMYCVSISIPWYTFVCTSFGCLMVWATILAHVFLDGNKKFKSAALYYFGFFGVYVGLMNHSLVDSQKYAFDKLESQAGIAAGICVLPVLAAAGLFAMQRSMGSEMNTDTTMETKKKK